MRRERERIVPQESREISEEIRGGNLYVYVCVWLLFVKKVEKKS